MVSIVVGNREYYQVDYPVQVESFQIAQESNYYGYDTSENTEDYHIVTQKVYEPLGSPPDIHCKPSV